MLKATKKIVIYIVAMIMMLSTAFGIIANAASIPSEETSSDDAPMVAGRVSLDVSYGYDNTAKGGRYMPVHISYQAGKDYEFDGHVELMTQESDGEIYEYDYDLTLMPDVVTKQDYYIPIGVQANRLSIKLIDNSGEMIAGQILRLNADTARALLNIGILSDTPQDLDYFENTSINYGRLRTSIIELSSNTFPDDAIGLDLLDIIIISNYRIRDLKEEQSRALMNWVADGGVLIMGTGDRVGDTLGRYAPELLDDMYTDPEETELGLSSSPEDSADGDSTITVPWTEFVLHGGNVVMSSGNKPLISTVNKTNGIIAVAGYDFVDIKDYVATHNTFIDSLLVRILGNTRISELTNQGQDNDATGYTSVQNLINVGDATKLPQVNLYYLEILAYILLIGPALFMFLRQRNQSRYYILGVCTLSVVFMAVIYLMGSKTRFTDTFYHYATVIDTDEETVKNTTYLNMMNPYNSSYTVQLSPEYSIRPITQAVGDGEAVRQLESTDTGTVRIAYNTDNTDVSVGSVGAFTPRFFELEGSHTNDLGDGFSGTVQLFGSEVGGEITNNYDFDVTGAAIVAFGKMILIGDMTAGETKILDGLEVLNIPLMQSYSTGRVITGLDRIQNTETTSKEYLRGIERTNLIAFYMDNYMRGYTADARVFAFSIEPLTNEDMIRDQSLESSGSTLLTSSIAVDSRRDEEIYRSVLMKNPQVMSGEYDVYSNTMYGIDPAVLNYTLGNDVTVDSICFEQVSPEVMDGEMYPFNYFDGEIALYNYDTGNYDVMTNDGAPIQADMLTDYLSPANNLIVRYTGEVRADGSEGIVLPMLTIVGSN